MIKQKRSTESVENPQLTEFSVNHMLWWQKTQAAEDPQSATYKVTTLYKHYSLPKLLLLLPLLLGMLAPVGKLP